MSYCPRIIALFLVCPLLLSSLFFSHAQAEKNWGNGATNNSYWNVNSNWSPNVQPSDNEVTNFNLAGTYEVWWNETTSNTQSGELFILSGANPTLLNKTGTQTYTVNEDLNIGNNSSLTLDDFDLFVNFMFLDGTSYGTCGTFNIETGSLFTSTAGIVGDLANSFGEVNVIGAGSRWTNSGNLVLGNDGCGYLNVESGGVVTSVTGYLGLTDNAFSGNAKVTGVGSQWNNSGDLHVGYNTSGYLDIENGGVVTSATGRVGTLDDGDGDVDVTGAGSQWNNSGDLIIGNAGNGTLNINDGGLVTVSGITSINVDSSMIMDGGVFNANGGLTNEGIIAISGGLSDFHGDITNTVDGQITIGSGSTTTFYDDVMMSAGNMNINVAANSTAVFFGSYNGGNDGQGSVHVFGDLRPGNSHGVVTFGGDLELGDSSTTSIELAGLSLGEFDQINSASEIHLNGLLDVSLLGGFVPSAGDLFEIITATGGVTGTFDDVLLPSLASGMEWGLEYGSNNVLLSIITTSADFDNDGDVDGSDFLTWQTGFGTIYASNDFVNWQAQYGLESGSGSLNEGASVPEPATWLVLLLGMTTMFLRRDVFQSQRK